MASNRLPKTGIPYADYGWNFQVGCPLPLVSEGCRECWARDGHNMRHKAYCAGKKLPAMYAKPYEQLQYFPERLEQPLDTKKPGVVFVGSQTDLFHESVPDEFIDRVFAVMALCPQHQFLILTKRAERMLHYFRSEPQERILAEYGKIEYPRGSEVYVDIWSEHDNWLYDFAEGCWPLPNVILGVSVSTQKDADRSIPLLLQTPAAMRIVSIEPQLEEIDISPWLDCTDRISAVCRKAEWEPIPKEETMAALSSLDLCICGGESGKSARPMHPDWARSLRDQCQAVGCDFYFKQWGRFVPYDEKAPLTLHCDYHCFADGQEMNTCPRQKEAAGNLLDGVRHDKLPWVQQKEIERLTRWQEEVERCGCLCSKCIVANNIVECSEKYPDSDNCLKSIRLELDARAEKEAVSHD